MTTPNTPPVLLRIDASARTDGSHSRQLADQLQAAWLARHPEGLVRQRDLAAEPLSHIDATTIQGFYTPPEQMSPELRTATARSDALIAELKGAHTLLIAAPMYNFSMPSALKAWIDQVVRVGHTFSFLADGRAQGLVTRPRALLALAYGMPGYDGAMAGFDHLKPYLVSVLNFIGMADVQVVATEGTSAGSETSEAAADAAKARIEEMFEL